MTEPMSAKRRREISDFLTTAPDDLDVACGDVRERDDLYFEALEVGADLLAEVDRLRAIEAAAQAVREAWAIEWRRPTHVFGSYMRSLESALDAADPVRLPEPEPRPSELIIEINDAPIRCARCGEALIGTGAGPLAKVVEHINTHDCPARLPEKGEPTDG